MGKRLLFLTVSLFFFHISGAFSQITGVTVDPGPYTPGSSIAVTFTIDPTACIAPGNKFDLYLVRPDGTEIPTPIGSYNGFYSTFVNGTIPNNTIAPPGTGYKLRIKSTNPVLTSTVSGSFEIKGGAAVNAQVDSQRLNVSDPSAFGFCTPRSSNAELIIENQSSAGGTVTAQITNELTSAQTSLNFNTPLQSFTPDLAHYTMRVKIVMPDGLIATKAYFIINNPTNIAFRTTTTGLVCLPEGTLIYGVDTSKDGIGLNFPGNLYRVSWGDNLVDYYTLCQLKSGVAVQHKYTTSSCGRNYNDGTTTHYNVFGVNISMEGPICGAIGSPLSTFAKVISITENRFSGPEYGCINTSYTFTNNSITGETPSSNTPGCEDPNVRYNWYLDGILVAANRLKSQPYIFPATSTPKLYTIRLTSTGGSACPSVPVTRTICIQAPPKPAFDITSGTTGCAPFPVSVQDRSILDLNCTPLSAYTYNWIVTDANGVEFTNFTDGIPNPQFNFTVPGVYTIALEITSGTCGPSRTVAPDPIVIINGQPTAVLSDDKKLCTLGTYKFDNTPNTVTTTTLTGTQVALPDTYTWTVTDINNNSLTAADYTFDEGTGPNSKYPSINFKRNILYKITVIHKNTCNPSGVTDSQILEFFAAPQINAGSDQNICFTQNSITLNAIITGITHNGRWVGGAGTFGDRNNPSTTYIPTAAERSNGLPINLTFTAETELADPCTVVSDALVLRIKPEIKITSPSTANICTGFPLNYSPTSNLSGTVYKWVSTGSASASGYTNSASPTIVIQDILVNSDPINNATVTYLITPINDGCDGDPFTLIVNVTPKPVITAIPVNPIICSNNSSAITLTSNLGPTTRYTWTSNAPTSITGSTNVATPTAVTAINEILVNNGTTRGTVTYTITPYSLTGCAGTPVVVTIDVDPAVTPANAGADATICEISTYDLKGNEPRVGTGLWTVDSTHPIMPTFADATAFETTVSGLVAGQAYTFRWTITGAGVCSNSSDDVVITVTPRPVLTAPITDKTICHNNPAAIVINSDIPSQFIWTSTATAGITGNTNPLTVSATANTITINDVLLNSTFSQGTVTYTIKSFSPGNCEGNTIVIIVKVDPAVTPANAGSDVTICSTSSYVLDGIRPDVGTGLWKVISASSGTPTFADATDSKTTVSGLNPGGTYTFEWEITGTGQCPGNADQVTVVVNMPTVPGTTSGAQTVCQNNNTGTITLTGFTGSVTAWQSLPAGQTVWTDLPGINTNPTYTFNNISVTTQYRAVVQNSSCTIEYSTPTTITVAPATTIATVAANQTLCNLPSATLTATSPLVAGETGTWTRLSGPINVQITDPSSPTTTVTNMDAGATYTFRWTITGNSPCGPTFADQTVRNNAPINQNISNSTLIVCNGSSVTINGSVPTGGDQNGIYNYTWESNTGAGPWSVISGETGEDLTITLTTTGQIGFRRVVSSGGCTSTSNELIFTVQPPITGNTIAADQTICSGTRPAVMTGNNTLTGGDGTFIYQWQSSLDGTNWSDVVGAQNPDFQPLALSTTTFYRRLVSTATCAGALQSISNAVKITVNPNAEAEYTWTADSGCAPFALQITAVTYPDRNGTYTWFANGRQIGTPNTTGAFPDYTIPTSNERVTIRLVVTSSLGCSSDLFEHDFSTNQAVPASFTPLITEGCGPLTVNFTNTSNLTAGATFRWDFGNEQFSNDANPQPVTFQPDPSGKDTTYTVTLYSITTCGPDTAKGTVLVKSRPRPIFSPSTTSGCADLTVNFTNNSPLQSGITYTFNFGDGTPPTQTTDIQTVPQHIYRTPGTFNATLTAQNECGPVTSEPYVIVVRPNTVSAELVVNGNQLRGCAPFTVTFDNNSTGATDFTIDFGDGTPARPLSPSSRRFTHTFTTAGPFTVTLTAIGCSTRTTTENIEVLPQPLADFTADNTLGCIGLVVKFRNTTQNGVSYLWEFGDGSTSTDVEPTHTYNGDQEYYTVTLTATNNLGCPMTVIKNQFIHVVQPPIAAFRVNPSTLISIPDYTFNFQDESTNNPTIWEWDFGDGTGSALKNPSHKYLDTGTYNVILRVENQQGCFSTYPIKVTIKGVPGYLFVPNSFIPGSDQPELRLFRAKGSGLQTWRFSVFNKWGQVLWETTKLEEGRPAEGWDGTFKGQAMPQGVYYWKIDVQMVNGTEWRGMTYDKSAPKRTGAIHLIR